MTLAAMDISENAVGALSIVCIFVIFPIVFAYARQIWKRTNQPERSKGLDDSAHRLAEMQRSIDAVAVEIERISEGQRFMTKLMADKQATPLGRVSSRSDREAD